MRFCVTGRCAGRCAACMYFYKCFGAVAKLDFEKGVNGLCVLNSADHFLAGFIYTSASLTQREGTGTYEAFFHLFFHRNHPNKRCWFSLQ